MLERFYASSKHRTLPTDLACGIQCLYSSTHMDHLLPWRKYLSMIQLSSRCFHAVSTKIKYYTSMPAIRALNKMVDTTVSYLPSQKYEFMCLVTKSHHQNDMQHHPFFLSYCSRMTSVPPPTVSLVRTINFLGFSIEPQYISTQLCGLNKIIHFQHHPPMHRWHQK